MYIKNFGEFFLNQIEHAGTIILSRTGKISQDKLNTCVEMIREHNKAATIITTPWEQLEGKAILETIEGAAKLEDMMKEMLEHVNEEHEHHHHEHHHEHGEECTCGCHGHHNHEHEHHHNEEGECCGHGHHHHEEHECCGHGHHHHEEGECCGHGHHHHEEGECCGHGHHHHEEHEHHHHHHADEVFTSWGMETPNVYSEQEISEILDALDSGEYGVILRAKGMVPAEDGTWIYYDYVPEEHEIRSGKPEVTGKICVIGSKLNEEKLAVLFRK